MPLHVVWHLVIRVFPIGITRESRLKHIARICLGVLAPVWSYGEVLTLAGSHLCTVIQAPLRS
jgi:hypothetical protein